MTDDNSMGTVVMIGTLSIILLAMIGFAIEQHYDHVETMACVAAGHLVSECKIGSYRDSLEISGQLTIGTNGNATFRGRR